MNNNLRTEFEEYVNKMVSAICKEIFLETLKNLCEGFRKNIDEYGHLSKCIQDTNNQISDSIDIIESECINVVQNLSEENKYLHDYTSNLFDELKNQHIEEKDIFIKTLTDCINKEKFELQKVFELEKSNIETLLSGIITQEQMNNFIEELKNNAKESKELANFVNSAYKTEIEDYFQKFTIRTDKAQEEITEKIENHVENILQKLDLAADKDKANINRYSEMFQKLINKQIQYLLEHFRDIRKQEDEKRDEFLEKQQKLISQIQPNQEVLDELRRKIDELDFIINKINYKNEKNNNQIKTMLDEYIEKQMQEDAKRKNEVEILEKRVESLTLKIYLIFSNTFMICMFALLIFFQKPWEIYGLQITLIITVIFILLFTSLIALGRIISKKIVSKENNT